jgi:type II secretory pathway component PulL
VSAVLTAEVKAYAGVIKLCAIGVCLGVAFLGGCHVQKKHDARKVALVEKQRDDAYTSLAASAAALKTVNAQAAANLAQAKASDAAAIVAGKSATIAEQAAKKQVDTFKARLVKAERSPACDALLNMNVGAVCALASH